MTKKQANSLLMGSLAALATLGTAVAVKADTVDARCDIYPAGEDRATSSGLCTYSQRQGVVGIQLQNGQRYDLQPVGDQPEKYQDQNGQPVTRDNEGLGDRGVIFRLTNEPSSSIGIQRPMGRIQEDLSGDSGREPYHIK